MVSSEPPVAARAAASYVRGVLEPLTERAPATWDAVAGSLEWSCRRTLAHMGDACNWYAALLARRATADVDVGVVDQSWEPQLMLDALTSAASVLDVVVAAADPADRGWWHGRGDPDRTGLAAMGCDEVLVHGFDIATSFGCRYEPPGDLCAGIVRGCSPGRRPMRSSAGHGRPCCGPTAGPRSGSSRRRRGGAGIARRSRSGTAARWCRDPVP